LLRDGIQYDENDDDVISKKEKQSIHHGRLSR